jgi:hypothetical protein
MACRKYLYLAMEPFADSTNQYLLGAPHGGVDIALNALKPLKRICHRIEYQMYRGLAFRMTDRSYFDEVTYGTPH